MNRTPPAPALAGLALLSFASGCTHANPARDEAAIRELVSAQTDAWNAHDAKAWSRDFTPDSEFINILGTVYQGHSEIETRHAAIFATLFAPSHDAVTVRRLVFPGPDVAVVDLVHEVTGHAGLPPGVRNTEEGLLRTQMRLVMKRIDGRWRIIVGQNTDVKPAP